MANRVQGCVFRDRCGYCGNFFSNNQNINKHQRYSCPNLNTQPYPKFFCFGCQKKVSETTFYRHLSDGCPSLSLRRRARLHALRDEQPIHFLSPFRMPGLRQREDNTEVIPIDALDVFFFESISEQETDRPRLEAFFGPISEHDNRRLPEAFSEATIPDASH